MHTRVRFIVPSLLTLAVPVLATVDFQQCFADIRQGLYGTTGGTDSQGNPVTIANATSITYELCLRACGTGSTPFSWPAFNQQFSAWLLPWLALTSQFPFGSRHKWENFLSAVLALGSPCLAAYSLILTVLHTKWLARRFANIEYPNGAYAARILNNLQQTPIMVRTDGGRLASLIVLPENDPWWMELAEKLDDADTHTWSIATAASIAWVVIAYALTIVDASSNIPANSESNLSGAGSIWVWMLPVTLAYLQISPRDPDRVTDALARARESSFVAGPNGVVRATQCALSLRPYRGSDQENPTPIYAYARFFPFIQAVEKIASALDNATEKFIDLQAVGGTDWVTGNGNSIDPANRTGTPEQIEEYCAPPEDAHVRGSYWGPEALSTFFIAALAALTLQWATTGASILLAYVTPAVGKIGLRIPNISTSRYSGHFDMGPFRPQQRSRTLRNYSRWSAARFPSRCICCLERGSVPTRRQAPRDTQRPVDCVGVPAPIQQLLPSVPVQLRCAWSRQVCVPCAGLRWKRDICDEGCLGWRSGACCDRFRFISGIY